MVLKVSTVQTAVERRRGEVERQFSIQDGIAHLGYSLHFRGPGEAAIKVNLPCWFSELPVVTSGFTMDESSVLTEGDFPWMSAGIVFTSQEVSGRTYFTEGRVVVLIGGPQNQNMTVHCAAVGKAIMAPA